MLEPDFDVSWNEPIVLTVEDGTFVSRNIFEGEPLLFYRVSGSLKDIYAENRTFRSGSFMYWHLELADNENGNTYVICFPYTSALFQSVILKLSSAENLNDIMIESYTDNTKHNYRRACHSKLKVFAGGKELFPISVRLPTITCWKIGGHIRKDYTLRVEAIKLHIERILSRLVSTSTRVHGR